MLYTKIHTKCCHQFEAQCLRTICDTPQLTMILAQSGLFLWKKRHKRSYELVRICTAIVLPPSMGAPAAHQGLSERLPMHACMHALQATLLGLWLVPAVISFHFKFWRFLLVWAIFTTMSGHMFLLCSAKRLDRTTPRRVRACFGTGALAALLCTESFACMMSHMRQALLHARPMKTHCTVSGSCHGIAAASGAVSHQSTGRQQRECWVPHPSHLPGRAY